MTRDTPADGEIATAGEFDAALGALLSSAVRNGVDPRGSWEYRDDGDAKGWEAVIVELAPRDATD